MKMQNMELTLGMGRGHKNVIAVVKFDDDRWIKKIKGHPHVYSLRGSDYDCGIPASIEEGNVVVNFVGHAYSKEALPLDKDGWLPIRDWWFID
jgi:hypothetical protein